MATTRLSDVIVPEVFNSYDEVNIPELNDFLNSGIAVQSPALANVLGSANGGLIVNTPFWRDLDMNSEPNYSTDNPADEAVPEKIEADSFRARIAFMNKGWSAADLVQELAGSDPMRRIRARVDAYWQYSWKRRVMAMALGAMASNIANNGGDMVRDVSSQDGSNATDANKFNRDTFIEATYTMGDQAAQIRAIGMHSMVMMKIDKNNGIEYIRDSENGIMVPYFAGKRIIVDDTLPVIAGTTSGFRYVSILFGSAAIGYDWKNPPVPTAVVREEAKGNGGGIETLWTRKTLLAHLFGFNWLDATVTGQSPTLANLRNAANWNRVLDRKQVPLAFLITN